MVSQTPKVSTHWMWKCLEKENVRLTITWMHVINILLRLLLWENHDLQEIWIDKNMYISINKQCTNTWQYFNNISLIMVYASNFLLHIGKFSKVSCEIFIIIFLSNSCLTKCSLFYYYGLTYTLNAFPISTYLPPFMAHFSRQLSIWGINKNYIIINNIIIKKRKPTGYI